MIYGRKDQPGRHVRALLRELQNELHLLGSDGRPVEERSLRQPPLLLCLGRGLLRYFVAAAHIHILVLHHLVSEPAQTQVEQRVGPQ